MFILTFKESYRQRILNKRRGNFKGLEPGHRSGYLTVSYISHSTPLKGGGYRTYYSCICDCGNTKTVEVGRLRREEIRSCGAKCEFIMRESLAKRARTMSDKNTKFIPGTRIVDLTSKRVGMLTVLSYSHRLPNGVKHWLCRCECGTEKVINGTALLTESIFSCGCHKGNTTHGNSAAHHPEYKTWFQMRDRCYNPKHKSYRFYGAKGIGMYPEWKDDSTAFITYLKNSIGLKPNTDYHIDRINPKRDYEPGNIRWMHYEQNACLRNLDKSMSGYLGVGYLKTGRYRSSIGGHIIGYFATPEEAAVEYDRAAIIKYDPRFVVTNLTEGLLHN